MTKKEEYEHLLRRSREFYETAILQLEKGFYDLAAFSLEQSLQLFLKAKVLERGVDYPRTHSIRRLLEILSEVVEREISNVLRELVDKYSLELASIEDAYITSKYIPREFRREEVLRLRGVVDEVIEVVSRIVS
ncbi:MAG: DNA-binding protein [Thermoprotei archaeon]|nr:MAG: DNA-binding protein [Thermoprotei archaeon]